ncbi:MAG TPA: hypothetical protein DCM08_06990 [Microscillaceae bacterium]|jgi:hypothetical protein|nr:hypothetical protein [Microscillaceae bacterium]
METHFETKYCHISYDPVNNWIVAAWKDYQTVEQIKTGMEELLLVFKKTGCGFAINDLRSSKGTFTAVNSWLANEWMPRALEAGYTLCAMVYPADIFTKFAVSDLARKYEKSGLTQFKLNSFDDINKAIQWIKQESPQFSKF